MKKILTKALLTLASVSMIAGSSITAQAAQVKPDSKSLYPQTFFVYEIDREEDIIYLSTFSGIEYIWEGIEDWHAGDLASALMYDNGTKSILDDEIIKLHYAGENLYDMENRSK